jgi:NAD(P)-dependent dehydrogenase (short-subunit alcohol dehydrogenase family)
MTTKNKRVLVTGGGTYLGDNIAAALLAEGAEVTLLVRPGARTSWGHWRSVCVGGRQTCGIQPVSKGGRAAIPA